MSATVDITEDDGEFTAVDRETGVTGVGESKALALAALAARLGDEDDPADAKAELRAVTERTRRRFEEAGVTEEDVDDALEWARSQ